MIAVTGGARGIGRATATELAARGARVAVGDLDGEGAKLVAAELGTEALGAPLDVSDREAFQAFLDLAEERLGPLYALINNAGVAPLGPFLSEPDEISRTTMDVNFGGVLNGMRLALPRMLERGHGHVINVASMAGKVGTPGGAVYAASKHAVVGLTEAVRSEIRGSDVELSLVLPSAVQTDLVTGVPLGRGVYAVPPEKVAAGIVGALEGGGRDVYVPGAMRLVGAGVATLPKPVLELVRRVVGDHRALTELDTGARADYEQRIADQATARRSL